MTDVAASVDVRVPVRTAYNQWTQFESFPAFMTGVLAVHQVGDRATHWVTEVGGAHREFDAEIVEQRPDERIVWQSTDGDLQHRGTVTFEPISSAETRVTVDMAWEPQGVVEKVGSLVGMDTMQVKSDLQKFKEFIEERGVETGQWRGQVPQPEPGMGLQQNPGMYQDPMQQPGTVTYEEPTLRHDPPMYDEPTHRHNPAMYADPAVQQDPRLQQIREPGVQQNPEPWTPAAPTTSASDLPPSYDVVDVLRTQHEQVKRLLEQTEAASGPDKERHFTELVNLLERHEKGERQVVHPVTRTTGQAGDQTAVNRLAEERKAEEQIVGLKGLDVASPEFDDQFARFKSAVLKHAEHEEAEEFPKLRQDIPQEQLRAMAEQLLSLQSSLS